MDKEKLFQATLNIAVRLRCTKYIGQSLLGLKGHLSWMIMLTFSDGRRTKNKNRPAEILVGTSVGSHGISGALFWKITPAG